MNREQSNLFSRLIGVWIALCFVGGMVWIVGGSDKPPVVYKAAEPPPPATYDPNVGDVPGRLATNPPPLPVMRRIGPVLPSTSSATTPLPPARTVAPAPAPKPAPGGSEFLMCCDGTRSPTCRVDRASYRGCCSHHGGVC